MTIIWRYGDTNPVAAPVLPETVIEPGDLVWLDGMHAQPAPWDFAVVESDASTLQDVMATRTAIAGFIRRFLGVAMQWSRAGETDYVRVATSGAFACHCPPADVLELGRLVGPIGRGLVQPVRAACLAFGRVCQHKPAGIGTVVVAIQSTILHGGIVLPDQATMLLPPPPCRRS